MQPVTIPNHIAYQGFKEEYNTPLMRGDSKKLIDNLSPEEIKVSAQLMRIELIAKGQKDKFKSLARLHLYANANPQMDVTERQRLATNRAQIWSLFKEAIDESETELEALAREHGKNANLRPFIESSVRAIDKIKKKYIISQGDFLPYGGARLDNSAYQKLKQSSVFMPLAWRDVPSNYTKRQSDFFSKEVSYEQAVSYLKFLVQIKTHESDMAKEFAQIAQNSPAIYSQIYSDYFPRENPWNVELALIGKERLAPGQFLGICCEPHWADRPICLDYWDAFGANTSFMPIAEKLWKFVILDQNNKVIQWEAGDNRRCDKSAFLSFNLNDVKFG